MEKTYLFYDIETSGLNKCFDQIFQFAAIRTDLDLNELERHNILIKLNSDAIPSPEALITHQIPLEKLQNEGITETKAINIIHSLMTAPGTISLGYNTLGFDDEFLRFSFYRNLLPPYLHQYANGCNRMDIYPLTAMYYLFKPEVLNWPTINDIPSLKLENLCTANSFSDKAAHDALTDVENTLKLAKNFHKETKMWDYLCGYFSKNIDLERINKLPPAFTDYDTPYKQAILVDGSFGSKNYFQIPALFLGFHNHYKNQTLWLSLDSPKLQETTEDIIAKNTFTIHKKLGEPYLVLPTTNNYLKYFSKDRLEIAQNNLKWLYDNMDLLQKIVIYHKEYTYPKIPNLDVDAALYQNGFLSDNEQNFGLRFNRSTLPEKLEMTAKSPHKLRPQIIRILGRNYYNELPENLQREYEKYLKTINPENDDDALVDYKNGKRLTARKALEKINELKASRDLTDKQIKILNELENYLINL